MVHRILIAVLSFVGEHGFQEQGGLVPGLSCPMARGHVGSRRAGTEPVPPALEVWSRSKWTTREVPVCKFLGRSCAFHFPTLVYFPL